MSWLRRSLALWLFLLFGLLALKLNAGSVVILQGDKAWFAPSESSIAVSVDRIVRIDGGPSDPSDPPIIPPVDPPTDPDDSELKTLSSTWVVKVSPPYPKRNTHRQALSAMYRVLSKRQKDGGFSNLAQMQDVTLQFRNLILAADKVKWDPWGSDIGVYLSEHVSSLAEAGDAYLDVAAGLESLEALGPILMKIIEAVLDGLLDGDGDNPIMLILIKLLLAGLGGGAS